MYSNVRDSTTPERKGTTETSSFDITTFHGVSFLDLCRKSTVDRSFNPVLISWMFPDYDGVDTLEPLPMKGSVWSLLSCRVRLWN